MLISFLFLVPLPVLGYHSVPRFNGPGISQCTQDSCWTDSKGSGFMPGESLAGYMTPDTNVSIDRGPLPDRTGDIVIFKEEYESQLDSAVLDATILRYPNFDIFKRYITSTAGKDIGYRSMERPFPDPDVRFRDLMQDPLLDTFPTGLRSAVDPASLIPSRTESCGTKPSNCFLIIPVRSFTRSIDFLKESDIPVVSRCLLLRPETDKYRLSLCGHHSCTVSCATSRVHVLNTTLAFSELGANIITRDPSSVYVVYQPPQIFDECRRWLGGAAGPPVTLSYPSSALSSIQYRSDGPPVTKSIDFADLPCPPSDVAEAYDPRAPYFPVLKSEVGIKFNMHVSQEDQKIFGDQICKVAAVRDPPVHAIYVGRFTGYDDGGSQIS